MVLSLEQIFKEKENRDSQEQIEVTCSYLEVYNEVRKGGSSVLKNS